MCQELFSPYAYRRSFSRHAPRRPTAGPTQCARRHAHATRSRRRYTSTSLMRSWCSSTRHSIPRQACVKAETSGYSTSSASRYCMCTAMCSACALPCALRVHCMCIACALPCALHVSGRLAPSTPDQIATSRRCRLLAPMPCSKRHAHPRPRPHRGAGATGQLLRAAVHQLLQREAAGALRRVHGAGGGAPPPGRGSAVVAATPR